MGLAAAMTVEAACEETRVVAGEVEVIVSARAAVVRPAVVRAEKEAGAARADEQVEREVMVAERERAAEVRVRAEERAAVVRPAVVRAEKEAGAARAVERVEREVMVAERVVAERAAAVRAAVARAEKEAVAARADEQVEREVMVAERVVAERAAEVRAAVVRAAARVVAERAAEVRAAAVRAAVMRADKEAGAARALERVGEVVVAKRVVAEEVRAAEVRAAERAAAVRPAVVRLEKEAVAARADERVEREVMVAEKVAAERAAEVRAAEVRVAGSRQLPLAVHHRGDLPGLQHGAGVAPIGHLLRAATLTWPQRRRHRPAMGPYSRSPLPSSLPRLHLEVCLRQQRVLCCARIQSGSAATACQPMTAVSCQSWVRWGPLAPARTLIRVNSRPSLAWGLQPP